jgi:outer membrane biogenesis lipoprotein LolB
MTTSEYQYALQRGATFLVMAAFSLALLAGITGSLLSGGASTNASSVEFLHKFSGHGLKAYFQQEEPASAKFFWEILSFSA